VSSSGEVSKKEIGGDNTDYGKKRVIHELDADKIISERVEIVDPFGNKNN
jgi:hypothetical protein